MSGSTSLILHPLVESPEHHLGRLSTTIHGVSGNLKVRFPSTWQGEIEARLSSGRVRHEWEGLRVLRDEHPFKAMSGMGYSKLNIRGVSGSVELVAEKVPGLAREEVREAGERVAVKPDTPGLQREGELQEKEVVPDLPKEEERQEQLKQDDDDWTDLGNEQRESPPSYEDATRDEH